MRTDEDKAKARKKYAENKEKRQEYLSKYYHSNPEYRKKHLERSSIRQQEHKYIVLSHYSGKNPKCAHCGITDIDVLSLDHINGGGNQHRKVNPHSYRWAIKENFPDGFQVLCFNCNWKKRINSQVQK